MAIATVLGNVNDKEPRLMHVLRKRNKSSDSYEMQLFKFTDDRLLKAGRVIPLDFLTRLNEEVDNSFINHITTWSNQIYMSDMGKLFKIMRNHFSKT